MFKAMLQVQTHVNIPQQTLQRLYKPQDYDETYNKHTVTAYKQLTCSHMCIYAYIHTYVYIRTHTYIYICADKLLCEVGSAVLKDLAVFGRLVVLLDALVVPWDV